MTATNNRELSLIRKCDASVGKLYWVAGTPCRISILDNWTERNTERKGSKISHN